MNSKEEINYSRDQFFILKSFKIQLILFLELKKIYFIFQSHNKIENQQLLIY